MSDPAQAKVVLAIHFNSRGFGFVLCDRPLSVLDWGAAEARGPEKVEKINGRVRDLFERYAPDFVVLQDTSYTGTPRPRWIRQLNKRASAMAEEQGFETLFFSQEAIRRCFKYLDPITKQGIAVEIGKRIPELQRLVPRPRKNWESEQSRMGIFDAAGLAFAFYTTDGDIL